MSFNRTHRLINIDIVISPIRSYPKGGIKHIDLKQYLGKT